MKTYSADNACTLPAYAGEFTSRGKWRAEPDTPLITIVILVVVAVAVIMAMTSCTATMVSKRAHTLPESHHVGPRSVFAKVP